MKTIAKWSLTEYHALVEQGFLANRSVELLDGELIEMAPESPQHCLATEGGKDYLLTLLGDRATIREAHPITLRNSEPEPDIAIVKPPRTRYGDRHPAATDIFWLIEVSKSTLEYDLHDKKRVYAQENISEYWVIDLANSQVHVFRDVKNSTYQTQKIYIEGEISPQAFPDISVSVKTLLG